MKQRSPHANDYCPAPRVARQRAASGSTRLNPVVPPVLSRYAASVIVRAEISSVLGGHGAVPLELGCGPALESKGQFQQHVRATGAGGDTQY
eukprot:616561-Rhodomonas_salina.2